MSWIDVLPADLHRMLFALLAWVQAPQILPTSPVPGTALRGRVWVVGPGSVSPGTLPSFLVSHLWSGGGRYVGDSRRWVEWRMMVCRECGKRVPLRAGQNKRSAPHDCHARELCQLCGKRTIGWVLLCRHCMYDGADDARWMRRSWHVGFRSLVPTEAEVTASAVAVKLGGAAYCPPDGIPLVGACNV